MPFNSNIDNNNSDINQRLMQAQSMQQGGAPMMGWGLNLANPLGRYNQMQVAMQQPPMAGQVAPQGMPPAMPGQPPIQQAKPGMKPIDLLTSSPFAKLVEDEKEKEISLESLKQDEIDKIMAVYTRCKKEADNYYTDTIEPKIQERRRQYLAREEYYKERFPVLSESSKFCSRDIKTTVDTLIPSFMEVFTGSDDPVDVKGVNIEDDEQAAKIQALLKYQLQRKNSYTPFMEFILKDALILNYAVAKVTWNRQEKRERYQMMLKSSDMNSILILYNEYQAGNVDIVSSEPVENAPDLIVLTFDKITLTSNYPTVSYMPPNELRFTPDAADLQSCKFVAHRKIVSGDYLKRKEQEGIYKNIDKAIQVSSGDTSRTSYEVERNEDIEDINSRLADNDDASKEIELYEAYFKVDYNNDGIYENVIVHAVGDTPIRISKNDFDLVPFFINEAEKDPSSVFNDNEGLCDNLIQLQDLKTAIFRQCIINVAKNNTPKTFVNERSVDMDGLTEGQEIIPVRLENGESIGNSVLVAPQLPLSQFAETILQYCQNEIESQSGSTRYNQGLDSNSLNKTATGLTALMGASEKRSKNTARLMAEQFTVPMMKYIILLNQKYLKDNEIVRLTNNSAVSIRKEDLDIDYDLIINVGQGAGTREAQIQYLMLTLNQIFPTLTAQGLTNEKSWFSLSKDLLEKMGIRNVSKYLVDPDSEQGKQLAAQRAQAAQQQQQMQLQLLQAKSEMDIKKAQVPHLSAQYTDLPQDAKLQVLEANGLKTTNSSIANQEVVNNA